jgi:hypothetical protein
LEEANFLSVAGIHAGLSLPEKIESCCIILGDSYDEPTVLLEWDRTELVHLMQCHQGVRRSLKAVLSWDIVRKLKAQRKLLASGAIDDPEEWTERRNRQTQHRYVAILHAILLYPEKIEKGRKELDKYRMIHHIDDEHHKMALAESGWTPEEFDSEHRDRLPRRSRTTGGDDEGVDEHKTFRDMKWYLEDIYLRVVG